MLLLRHLSLYFLQPGFLLREHPRLPKKVLPPLMLLLRPARYLLRIPCWQPGLPSSSRLKSEQRQVFLKVLFSSFFSFWQVSPAISFRFFLLFVYRTMIELLDHNIYDCFLFDFFFFCRICAFFYFLYKKLPHDLLARQSLVNYPACSKPDGVFDLLS